jgi:hypothetical protein
MCESEHLRIIRATPYSCRASNRRILPQKKVHVKAGKIAQEAVCSWLPGCHSMFAERPPPLGLSSYVCKRTTPRLSSRGLRGTLYLTQLVKRRLSGNGSLNAQLEIQGPSEASG